MAGLKKGIVQSFITPFLQKGHEDNLLQFLSEQKTSLAFYTYGYSLVLS